MKMIKEIETNEFVLTMYNIISSMYYSYSSSIPQEVSQKINELLETLTNDLEREYFDLDIVDSKLIRKVEFSKKD
ncbi:MAG: hypothetical protein HFI87_04115 [Bacilli bacterium]|nr:hypothetical protein [Bacilli bacterium]